MLRVEIARGTMSGASEGEAAAVREDPIQSDMEICDIRVPAQVEEQDERLTRKELVESHLLLRPSQALPHRRPLSGVDSAHPEPSIDQPLHQCIHGRLFREKLQRWEDTREARGGEVLCEVASLGLDRRCGSSRGFGQR